MLKDVFDLLVLISIFVSSVATKLLTSLNEISLLLLILIFVISLLSLLLLITSFILMLAISFLSVLFKLMDLDPILISFSIWIYNKRKILL